MNVYHIAYASTAKTAHIFFWGCVLKEEIYDWHMEETRQARLRKIGGPPQPPQRFLKLEEVMDTLRGLEGYLNCLLSLRPTLFNQAPSNPSVKFWLLSYWMPYSHFRLKVAIYFEN